MRYSDGHIHSLCSDDGSNTMLEMALASYDKGVRYLCFTDHCDMDSHATGEPDPDCFSNRSRMKAMYEEALAGVPGDMELRLGLELGEPNHNVELASEIAASPELDLVLGSLHNLRGMIDFYDMEFTDEGFCEKIIDGYADELIEISRLDCFDVMAHIGYAVRYVRKAGFQARLNMSTHRDKLEALLRSLVERGKGLEINCAGLWKPILGGVVPETDVLKRYRELGGEIITVGSDAHSVRNAGGGVRQGFDILRDLGYKYVATYENHKPRFEKI